MLVGNEILKRGLIVDGKPDALKNGTYDLTVGEIFPVGREEANKQAARCRPLSSYSLAPQEMVWVLSNEHFKMTPDVTGLATLRTTYTHQGLLALNVGIIDSHFEGQISTVIINFSDRTRTIKKGEAFFRVMFFEHEPLAAPPRTDKPSTREDVLSRAAGDFPKNFLNLPGDSNVYYGDQLSKLVMGFAKSRPVITVLFAIFVAVIFLASLDKLILFADAAGLIDIDKILKLIRPSSE